MGAAPLLAGTGAACVPALCPAQPLEVRGGRGQLHTLHTPHTHHTHDSEGGFSVCVCVYVRACAHVLGSVCVIVCCICASVRV